MVEYAFVVTCPGFSAYGMISFFLLLNHWIIMHGMETACSISCPLQHLCCDAPTTTVGSTLLSYLFFISLSFSFGFAAG